MSFFEDIKDVIHRLWEGLKPTFWQLFQYVLPLVVAYAEDIVAGVLTKEEAREKAVADTREQFATANPGLYSENKARFMVEFCVMFYKRFGKMNSDQIVSYSSVPDFMAWYTSRVDKTDKK